MHTRERIRRRTRTLVTAAWIALGCGAMPFAAAQAASEGFGAGASAAPGAVTLSVLAGKSSLLPSLASTDVVSLYSSTTAFTTVSFERIELPVTQSGTFEVSLTDLLFPERAATLSFALVDGDAVLGVIDGSGSLQYSLVTAGPKTLFGYTYAVATPGVNAGAYSLDVNYAPVPLPAAAWLFLSGLGLLGLRVRRGPALVIRRSYK